LIVQTIFVTVGEAGILVVDDCAFFCNKNELDMTLPSITEKPLYFPLNESTLHWKAKKIQGLY
jgi:hypothetical protein